MQWSGREDSGSSTAEKTQALANCPLHAQRWGQPCQAGPGVAGMRGEGGRGGGEGRGVEGRRTGGKWRGPWGSDPAPHLPDALQERAGHEAVLLAGGARPRHQGQQGVGAGQRLQLPHAVQLLQGDRPRVLALGALGRRLRGRRLPCGTRCLSGRGSPWPVSSRLGHALSVPDLRPRGSCPPSAHRLGEARQPCWGRSGCRDGARGFPLGSCAGVLWPCPWGANEGGCLASWALGFPRGGGSKGPPLPPALATRRLVGDGRPRSPLPG